MLTDGIPTTLGERVMIRASKTSYFRNGAGRIPYGTRIQIDLIYRFKQLCCRHDLPMSRVVEELMKEFCDSVEPSKQMEL